MSNAFVDGLKDTVHAVAGHQYTKLASFLFIVFLATQQANDWLHRNFAPEPATDQRIAAIEHRQADTNCSVLTNTANIQLYTVQTQIEITQIQLQNVRRYITEHKKPDDSYYQLRDNLVRQQNVLNQRYNIILKNLPTGCKE